MMRRALSIALGLVVIAALIIIAAGLFIFLAGTRGPATPNAYQAYSQAEFVTIILTAVTVILTALAIILALGGAVGYVTIRDAVTRAAEAEARKVAHEIASEVAARTAEQVATQTSGRDVRDGELFAKAEGGMGVSNNGT